MDPSAPQNTPPTLPVSTPRSLLSFPVIIIIIVTIVITGTGGYFLGQQRTAVDKTSLATDTPQNNLSQDVITPTPLPTSAVITPSSSPDQKWIRTNTLGVVSYEYPTGWHVAELWNSGYESEGIAIVMGQRPISTAPRDGSLDEVLISELNGLPNPEAKLQEKITNFKKDLQNITTEQIPLTTGVITHIKGRANIYEELRPVEGYFLLIPAKTVSDKLNYQIIQALVNPESSAAPVVRHVMESFKRE